ncbi:TPA: fimbria/pilus periplasmic chaperone [Raoultella planticola]|nr:fimbria/pilus periplasmic chaperone [Raoultella planticola]
MKKKISFLIVVMAVGSGVIAYSHAAEPSKKIDVATQSFAVKLGMKRVVYAPDSNGVALSVENPQDYPMLVKSQVFDEDRTTQASFVVTPPLFRLDGKQQSRLRIVRTGGVFAPQQETLKWLCVTGIPPKADDIWAQGGTPEKKPEKVSLNVQLSISTCIKLLIRPSFIKGESSERAGDITWIRNGNKLIANNPSPFYMSLTSLRVGGKAVNELEYIAPSGTHTFDLPKGAGDQVEWKVMNDYGGDSKAYTAPLKP